MKNSNVNEFFYLDKNIFLVKFLCELNFDFLMIFFFDNNKGLSFYSNVVKKFSKILEARDIVKIFWIFNKDTNSLNILLGKDYLNYEYVKNLSLLFNKFLNFENTNIKKNIVELNKLDNKEFFIKDLLFIEDFENFSLISDSTSFLKKEYTKFLNNIFFKENYKVILKNLNNKIKIRISKIGIEATRNMYEEEMEFIFIKFYPVCSRLSFYNYWLDEMYEYLLEFVTLKKFLTNLKQNIENNFYLEDKKLYYINFVNFLHSNDLLGNIIKNYLHNITRISTFRQRVEDYQLVEFLKDYFFEFTEKTMNISLFFISILNKTLLSLMEIFFIIEVIKISNFVYYVFYFRKDSYQKMFFRLPLYKMHGVVPMLVEPKDWESMNDKFLINGGYLLNGYEFNIVYETDEKRISKIIKFLNKKQKMCYSLNISMLKFLKLNEELIYYLICGLKNKEDFYKQLKNLNKNLDLLKYEYFVILDLKKKNKDRWENFEWVRRRFMKKKYWLAERLKLYKESKKFEKKLYNLFIEIKFCENKIKNLENNFIKYWYMKENIEVGEFFMKFKIFFYTYIPTKRNNFVVNVEYFNYQTCDLSRSLVFFGRKKEFNLILFKMYSVGVYGKNLKRKKEAIEYFDSFLSNEMKNYEKNFVYFLNRLKNPFLFLSCCIEYQKYLKAFNKGESYKTGFIYYCL